MRVSWKGIILAPLPVPLAFALTLAAAPNQDRLWVFWFFFGMGCVFSYGATLALLLPCLWVLSRVTRLSVVVTGLAGLVLGLVVYFPVCWQSYLSSGDNSGPPTEGFLAYLTRNFWAESWMFYAGGLVTAVVYWLLTPPGRRN